MSSKAPYRDPFYPRPRKLSAERKRLELLATGGIGAFVAMLCVAPPSWAATRSYQGTANTGNFNVSVTESTDHTQIEINEGRSIITWSPADSDGSLPAPVDFQPAGTTATFSGVSGGVTDFTVLNIVNAPGSRVIKFSGATNSLVSDGSGGALTGGTVWFYSPNGFLAGTGATFNVGSLMLTANRPGDIDDPMSPDGYNHNYNISQTSLASTTGTATIQIDPGAQITASNYVALVAPRIVQNGTVRAGGEIAYVAGEEVDLTMPLGGGLFGISVPLGSDGTTLIHGGTTGGPATSDTSQRRNIYMVAVPKNVAVTMLIGGTIGYDTAQAATELRDGTLLLTGSTLFSGEGGPTALVTAADLPGTIAIDGAHFKNNLTATSSHVTVATNSGDVLMDGNAALNGVLETRMNIGAGRSVVVGGDLSLIAHGPADPEDPTQVAGVADITIDGGTLQVPGNLLLDAQGTGLNVAAQDFEQQVGGDGRGGTATLTVNDGTVLGGLDGTTPFGTSSIKLNANGFGGAGNEGGGRGLGGTAALTINGGTVRTFDLAVSASGQGGDSETNGSDGSATAGQGVGNSASLILSTGQTTPLLDVSGAVLVTASGAGGNGICDFCDSNSFGATAGGGQGGTATIGVGGGAIAASALTARASAVGGNGAVGAGPGSGSASGYYNGGRGGDAVGGTARIGLTGGQVTTDVAIVDAGAAGGAGGFADVGEGGSSPQTGTGGNGGNATGGDARVQVANAIFQGVLAQDSLAITSAAIGGIGGGSARNIGGDGGFAVHGQNTLSQLSVGAGAQLTFGTFTVDASAIGGDGGDYVASGAGNHGGDATGGTLTIDQTGGIVAFGNSTLTTTTVRGVGGDRGDNFRYFAGAAQGGAISATVSAGTLGLGGLLVDASGTGKTIEDSTTLIQGGAGRAGAITLTASNTGTLTASNALIGASGKGGDGFVDTGEAAGGAVTFTARDTGSIQLGGSSALVDTSAIGGRNVAGVNAGGLGVAGDVTLQTSESASIALPSVVSLSANGTGGDADLGRDGRAGTVSLTSTGGSIIGTSLSINAIGTAGSGVTTSGNGVGGHVLLAETGGSLIFGGFVSATATGIGATAGATGGSVDISTNGGGGLSLGSTIVSVNATSSGAGNTAGSVTIGAGQASITLASLTATAQGDDTTGNVAFSANQAGRVSVAGALEVSTTGGFTLTHNQPVGPALHAATASFTTGTFHSFADTTIETTTSLAVSASNTIQMGSAISGDTISLIGTQGVSLGGAVVTGPAVGQSGMLDPTHSLLQIIAGDGSHAAGISISGVANAAGTVDLRAAGTISINSGAQVSTSNRASLVAGNDLIVGSGASIIAAASPFDASSGQLVLTAGGGQYEQPGVHSLILGGTIDAFAAPAVISGDAIQASGSTILAGSLLVGVTNVPQAGTPADTDGGLLAPGCTAGSICLGGVTVTGALSIGSAGIPATATLSGPVSARSIELFARDGITLGNALGPTTIAASEDARYTVDSGSIVGIGSPTLTTGAGFDLFLSADAIVAPTLSAQAGRDLRLPNTQSIALLDAIAGGKIVSTDGELSPIAISGAFSVLGTFQVGVGPADITANSIAIGRLKVATGAQISLDTSMQGRGDISIGDGSASEIGLASSASITGRAIAIGKLAAAGAVTLDGSGAVQVGTDLAAGGSVSANGTSISLNSLGALRIASAVATAGDLTATAGGDLSFTSGSATGALQLASIGASVSTGSITTGGSFSASAATDLYALALSARSISLNATTGIISGGYDGAATIATGGDFVATARGDVTFSSTSATGAVRLTSQTGRVYTGPLTVGTDLLLHAASSVNVFGLPTVAGAVDLVSSAGSVNGDALTASGNITASGATGVAFSSLSGATVVLSSSTGIVSLGDLAATNGATLTAGGTVEINGAVQVAGPFNLTGSGVYISTPGSLGITSATATNGDLELRPDGSLTLGSGSATGNAFLTSTNGGLGIGSLTAASATLVAPGAITIANAAISAPFSATGGSIAIGAQNALALSTAIATSGNLSLTSQNGGVSGTYLSASGAVTLAGAGAITAGTLIAGGGATVTGSSIALTAPNGLTLTSATATAGDIDVTAADDLTLTAGSATGAIRLTSTNRSVSIGAATIGTDLRLRAGGSVTVGDLTVPGSVDIASTVSGISAGTILAGGDIIANGNGYLSFTRLSGRTLTLGSAFNLSGARITATNGATLTSTGGGITVTTDAVVTGPFAVSAGTVVLAAAGPLTLTSLDANSAQLTSGGALSVTGRANTLQASGASVTVNATGALRILSATATAGDLAASASGALQVVGASATGAATLTSTTGAVTIGTATAGGTLNVTAATDLGFTALSGRTLGLTAGGDIRGRNLAATNGATLIAGGAIVVDTDVAVAGPFTLGGRSIALTATGPLALTSATATGGDITLASGGALSFGSLSGAGIDLSADAGGITGTGIATAGSAKLRTTGAIAINGSVRADGGADLAATSIAVTSDTALTVTRAVASAGGITLAGPSVDLRNASATGPISVSAANGIDFQQVGGGAITFTADRGHIVGTGLTATGVATLTAATDVTINGLSVGAGSSVKGGTVTLTNTGALALGTVTTTTGDARLSGSSITLDTLNSAGGVTFNTNGGVSIASLILNADLTLSKAGDIVFGNVATSGAIDLASTGGSLTTGSLAAGGNIALSGATGLSFTTLSGRTLTLSGGTGALTGSGITATNGATLTAGGAITVGQASVAGAFSATGRSLAISAPGALTMTNATATGGNVVLAAQNGGLSVAHLAATGTATLAATGAIVSGDISAAGGVTAIGGSISLTAPGALVLTSAVATSGDLSGQSVGDLTLLSGSASRSISLASSAGAVRVTNAGVGAGQQAQGLLAPSALSGEIAITAATTATLDGAISTAGAITVVANDATVTGSVVGQTIGFSTRGITIGSAARIGQLGTTTGVTFTNSGTQRSFIGSATGTGYLLTAAGLLRVQADSITLNLPLTSGSSAATPDVTIGDLTLHGATGTAQGTLANLSSTGSFTINTPGRVRIDGKLALTDLAAGNILRIAAGPEIYVVSPTGSILLTTTAGTPTGLIDLSAQRIYVASQSALTDLGTITGTDARATRLATNDGPVTDQGYLAADKLTFRITELLDVQNSGGSAAADRRGVTAGSGGVDIIVGSTTPPEVILNGRTSGTSDFAGQVRIASASGGARPALTSGSTINGCNLTLSACGGAPTGSELTSLILPQQDVVGLIGDLTGGSGNGEDDKKSGDESHAAPAPVAKQTLITLAKTKPYSYDTVIDEPVTGSPNDDLWIDAPASGTGVGVGTEGTADGPGPGGR